MKLKGQQGGFTIVETLIVLATMSILFVVALVSMLSYLKQNTFTTGLSDLQQQFQSYVTTSVNGQYNIASGSQGTDYGKVFIGTALTFGDGNYTSMTAYPLSMADCTFSLSCSANQFLGDITTTPVSTGNLISSSYSFEGGLKLIKVTETYSSSGTSPSLSSTNPPVVVVFGFADPFAPGSAGINSAAANYTLYPFTSQATFTGNVASYITGGTLESGLGNLVGNLVRVDLCFQGSTTQAGVITIGDTAGATYGSLGVSTNIYSSIGATSLC